MHSSFRGVLFLVYLVASCGVLASPTSASVDPKIEMLLLQQHSYFQRIASLEFRADMIDSLNEAYRSKLGAPKTELSVAVTFAFNEDNYLCRTTFSDWDTGATVTWTMAYNGSVYQWHRSDGNRLIITDLITTPLPYNTNLPILLPFDFAATDNDTSITAMLRSERWTETASKVTSLAEQTRSGMEGYALRIEKPDGCGGKATYDVFFAADMQYFPMQYVVTRDGDLTYECKVTDTAKVETSKGQIIIPVCIEYCGHSVDGAHKLNRVWKIDVSTLKVNLPIDKSVFTLPTEGAEVEAKLFGSQKATLGQ